MTDEPTSRRGTQMDTAKDSIAQAPLPTPDTLKSRTSLPKQAIRFGAINIKMIRMILKGHH
jgi:hypothetical protein